MKNEKMLLYKKIMVTVVSGGMLLLPNWAMPCRRAARSWAAVAVSALLAAVQWILPATAAIWL